MFGGGEVGNGGGGGMDKVLNPVAKARVETGFFVFDFFYLPLRLLVRDQDSLLR